MKLELFYAINDIPSAAARKRVTERHLLDRLRFRNLFYPEVEADFRARGGTTLPALWDGERLIQGEAAVLAALDQL